MQALIGLFFQGGWVLGQMSWAAAAHFEVGMTSASSVCVAFEPQANSSSLIHLLRFVAATGLVGCYNFCTSLVVYTLRLLSVGLFASISSYRRPLCPLYSQLPTMSRYRRTDDDLAYGALPPTERWDAGRFSRESQQYRQAPVIEQRPPYESARRREPAYYEDDRYFSEQRTSGPGGTRDRQFFEEDEYYDPRANQGAMIPFRPARPARPAPAPRPAMMRRQSSVDRIDFDRRRERQYERDDYRPPPPRPRQGRNPHYEINIYDDVKVQDPEYYGDDGFREYREREWVRTRSRHDSPSPDRRAPTEIIDVRPPPVQETIVQKEMIVEKPYPRKGKTRMPKRLVHTSVLYDLGYPFYEEVCNTGNLLIVTC